MPAILAQHDDNDEDAFCKGISFYYKCKPLQLKLTLTNSRLTWQYSLDSPCYQDMCYLDFDNQQGEFYNNRAPSLTLFSQHETCFKFLIVTDSNSNKQTQQKLGLELFHKIFPTCSTNSTVLLIGDAEGYVYWIPLDTSPSSSPVSMDKHILMNSQSSIVHIDTLEITNTANTALDHLFKKPNTKPLICLLIVTRAGQLYIYCDNTQKSCLLSHYVKSCVCAVDNRTRVNKLLYATFDNQLFIVNMDTITSSSTKDQPVKAEFVKTCFVKQLYKDELGNVYVKCRNGTSIPIDLSKTTGFGRDPAEQIEEKNPATIKSTLNTLCHISNRIVTTQMKLDRLNSALKQLNVLQSIKHGEDLFDVSKKFCSRTTVELLVKNKGAPLEDHLNKSYLLFVCVKMSKVYNSSFYWAVKSEKLHALKINSQQTLQVHLGDNKCMTFLPSEFCVYLVYDAANFLIMEQIMAEHAFLTSNDMARTLLDDKTRDELRLNEISICIHKSRVKFEELLVESKTNQEDKCSLSLVSQLLLTPRFVNETAWTNMTLKKFPMETLFSHLNSAKHMLKSHVFPNMSLKAAENAHLSISIDLRKRTDFEKCLMQMICLKSLLINKNSVFQTKCDSLFFHNNQAIFEDAFYTLTQMKDKLVEKKEQDNSLDTLNDLLDIYLNLRKIVYSASKANSS